MLSHIKQVQLTTNFFLVKIILSKSNWSLNFYIQSHTKQGQLAIIL